MSNSTVMLKKVGTGFEVSNGTHVIQGPNRAELLAIMDTLTSAPANVEAIQAKVVVAQEVVAAKKSKETTKTVKKAKPVSAAKTLRAWLEKMPAGKEFTVSDAASGTALTNKQCADNLWRFWKADELKSEVRGIYFK